jgi:PAS domain-containing protein
MPDQKPTYQELEHQINTLKKAQIDAVTDTDHQYKMLFDSMAEMLGVIELIYDTKGQPIDFYIREINPSYANFLGKPKDQLVNKKASEIIDTIEDHWLTAFASVDKTGSPTGFENYGIEFNK